ncbi:hypothetical protein C0995_015758 [Termitomyces sp. Mi166|nr:hypothetical protein C0995_015758 [Termitomyces sp. Mi166\
MVWLDGKPTLVKTLAWPADDPDLTQRCRGIRDGWSVLDDQIVFWKAFSVLVTENPRTVIYMANTASARDTQADTITLERVAELDYAAHRLAIVPNIGFVTAEWRSDSDCLSGVYFRAHSGTGELLRECHCPAKASYGELSVFGPTVSLCVTSTDPIPPRWKDIPPLMHYHRLDHDSGYTRDQPIHLVAETIATWNADSGDLRMVKIPQTDLGEIQHHADFQYISPDKIVLASSLAFDCGAVLCAFSANAEDEEPLKFYHGDHTTPEAICHNLGETSTSTSNPIIVHDHDGEGRITIFKRELLSGDIPSIATTRDPPGLRDVFDYPNDARTLNFKLCGFLSVAAARILVYHQDFIEEPRKIFVLDFDQTLLASLLSKRASERADWNAQLVDGHAQVKVVTRRFHCGLMGCGGEVYDQEYPWPQRAPPEWEAHLAIILREDDDEDEDMDDSDSIDSVEALPSGVEYDEAPEEHRDPIPFGYIQTALYLEGVTKANRLAITRHAILEIPEPTGNGRVFYFD